MQALERKQPGLPIKRGRAGTVTHDYKRNGTTTLFVEMDYLTAKVLGQCMPRRRGHQEFLRFLRHIDKQGDASQQVHVILDNYATHKHPAVRRWLARHPRFEFHFVPTSCSWMNLVERISATLHGANEFSRESEMSVYVLFGVGGVGIGGGVVLWLTVTSRRTPS